MPKTNSQKNKAKVSLAKNGGNIKYEPILSQVVVWFVFRRSLLENKNLKNEQKVVVRNFVLDNIFWFCNLSRLEQ